MRLKSGNKTYIIEKAPSIYTYRNNENVQLEDITIFESSHTHGIKFNGENTRFVTVAKFAAEDFSMIRSYKKLTKDITFDLLRQWGF